MTSINLLKEFRDEIFSIFNKYNALFSLPCRVCFAIMCLFIGAKLANNKHIVLLLVIQGDLSN